MSALILFLSLALVDEPKGQLAAPEGPSTDIAAQASPSAVPLAGVPDLPPIGPPRGATLPSVPGPDPLRTIAGFVLDHGLAVLAMGSVLFGCLSLHIANRRGLPVAEGIAYGVIFGPLGALVTLLIPAPGPEKAS